MLAEQIFCIAFWVLLGGVLAFWVYFAVRVRLSGEQLMPDRQAVQREWVGFYVLRVVLFFILIAILVSFGLNLPWLRFLEFPLPGWLHWIGFFLGIASLVLLAWTELALGKAWSAQLQLRQEHTLMTSGPYTRLRHPLYTALRSGTGFCTGDRQLDFCGLYSGHHLWSGSAGGQRRADDDRKIRQAI